MYIYYAERIPKCVPVLSSILMETEQLLVQASRSKGTLESAGIACRAQMKLGDLRDPAGHAPRDVPIVSNLHTTHSRHRLHTIYTITT